MFGSNMPGARTTAVSSREGRMKSGGLSSMKSKKRFASLSSAVKGGGVAKGSNTSASQKSRALVGMAKMPGSTAVTSNKVASAASTIGTTGVTDRASQVIAKVKAKLDNRFANSKMLKGKK